MKKASKQYPQLKGYYPKPKPIMFSYFMSQTGTSGMYFPFSMEATYNNDMIPEIMPEVICHEYAHLKGFMQIPFSFMLVSEAVSEIVSTVSVGIISFSSFSSQ